MAQQVTALAAKPNDPSSILRIHTVKERLSKVVLRLPHKHRSIRSITHKCPKRDPASAQQRAWQQEALSGSRTVCLDIGITRWPLFVPHSPHKYLLPIIFGVDEGVHRSSPWSHQPWYPIKKTDLWSIQVHREARGVVLEELAGAAGPGGPQA